MGGCADRARDSPCRRTTIGPLSVFRLPKRIDAQQQLIDRAEEDLWCAVRLCRGSGRGYVPFTDICYLLHQAVEKWIKVVRALAGLRDPPHRKRHDLRELVEPVSVKYAEFSTVLVMIEAVDPRILKQRFPAELRYGLIMPEVHEYVAVLMRAAFEVRRMAKRRLREEATNGGQV